MTVSDYLINLIRATVRNEMPMEKPEGISWQEVFKLAQFHQVVELAFFSVKKLQNQLDKVEKEGWGNAHKRCEVIDILQREEAQLIIEEATKKQIGILPLKGYIFKQIYPKPALREMGDLDFLIEPDKIDEMRSIMKELSYKADEVGLEASHDVYSKEPYLIVENHRRLLPPTEENHWYTDDIWERLESDSSNPYIKTMTWTDFYLYHLLHFEKHYSMSGIGIRAVVDQYYAITKLKDKIDWDKVKEILPKMNYVEFEKMVTELALALFDEGKMTEKLEEAKDFIMKSGSHGTFEEYKKFEFETYKKEQGIKTKRGLFFRRMFMERERMEFIYPSLKKHGWLLPFCWIHRLFKAVFTKGDKVKLEMDQFKNNK